MLRSKRLETSLGAITLAATERGLCRLSLSPQGWGRDGWWERFYSGLPREGENPVIELAELQLREYLDGRRREFSVPLELKGTEFQMKVWRVLQEIPYGQSTSYGALSRRLELDRGARAVGAANGQNPIPIFVPCHRVMGSGGSLVGFSGGLEIKEKLLELEGLRIPWSSESSFSVS